jgi:ParB family chromosome partitioning protein
MKVGKPRSYIVHRLQLLKLDRRIQDGFLKGKIELGHALELCRLQPEDQKKAWNSCFESSEGGSVAISVPQLRGWIRDNLFRDLSKVPWDVKDEALVPKAGSCVACPKRVGNQPDLFGVSGVKQGDTCTDGACFQSKREAFVGRAIEENEKKGTPLLKLAETWKPRGSGLVGTDSYRGLRGDEKDCPDTKRGIMVEAWQERVGEIRKVCTAKRCPTHSGYADDGPGSKNKAKDDRRKQELVKAGRKTILLAVLQSVHAVPTRKDLELSAESFLSNLHQDHRIVACSLFGWVDELRGEWDKEMGKHKPKKGELRPRFSPDLIQHAGLRLKTMSDEQLSRFIIACSLVEDLSGPRWVNDNRDVLLEAAEIRGIDTKEVLRQVRKDFEAKWRDDDTKKKAKKANAKAAPKGAGKKVGTKKAAGAKMAGASKGE